MGDLRIIMKTFTPIDRTTIGGAECIKIEATDPPEINEVILVGTRQLKVLDIDKPWICFDYSISGPRSHDFWWLKVEVICK